MPDTSSRAASNGDRTHSQGVVPICPKPGTFVQPTYLSLCGCKQPVGCEPALIAWPPFLDRHVIRYYRFGIRKPLKNSELSVKLARKPEVVGVQECQVFAARRGD